MAERSPPPPGRLFRLACLALLGLLAFQALRLWAGGRDALRGGGIEIAPPSPPAAGEAGARPEEPLAPLPERYRVIDAGGIFGRAPRKEASPQLVGIAGHQALLLAPDGQSGLVAEGGELGGMKVLKISTNRVLIEYQGQQKELTIFSGLGSSSLLPAGKDQRP